MQQQKCQLQEALEAKENHNNSNFSFLLDTVDTLTFHLFSGPNFLPFQNVFLSAFPYKTTMTEQVCKVYSAPKLIWLATHEINVPAADTNFGALALHTFISPSKLYGTVRSTVEIFAFCKSGELIKMSTCEWILFLFLGRKFLFQARRHTQFLPFWLFACLSSTLFACGASASHTFQCFCVIVSVCVWSN